MKWFGERPWSNACDDSPRVEIPTGEPCLWCEEPIEPNADGVLMPHVELASARLTANERPMHAECFLRQMAGSYAHQRGLCGCGGQAARLDPKVAAELAGLSKREEATLAAEFFCQRVREDRAEAAKGTN